MRERENLFLPERECVCMCVCVSMCVCMCVKSGCHLIFFLPLQGKHATHKRSFCNLLRFFICILLLQKRSLRFQSKEENEGKGRISFHSKLLVKEKM